MSVKGNDGQRGQSVDVRDKLHQLATEIKGQSVEVDRRSLGKRPTAEVEDSPWDQASAEALTRLYEGASPSSATAPSATPVKSIVGQPLPRTMAPKTHPIYFSDPPVHAEPRIVTSQTKPQSRISAPIAAVPTGPSALALLAADRDWLDGRLAELQTKVEATLSSFDPEPIVAPVSARLDRLEGNLLDVLGTVAQRADLERFSSLEADVTAIKSHVEVARDQLKRLDGIESQLKNMQALATESSVPADVSGSPNVDASAQRINDIESMVRDLHTYAAEQSQTPPASVEPPDFHGLAAKAADRAAANVVEQYRDLFAPSKRAEMAQLAEANAGPTLKDMQSLLEGYQSQQQHEASQTAAALTTMQEALIRLIDRIEELAGEAPSPTEAAAGHAPAPSFVEVENERAAVPGRRASDAVSSQVPVMSVEQALAEQQAQAAAARAAVAPVAPRPTSPRAARSTRATEATPPHEEIQVADETAAAAMAAERARVQAERSQGRRPASARPQVTIAPDEAETPDAAAAPERKSRKAKSAGFSRTQTMIGLAAGGLLMLGSAFLAQKFLGTRSAENAKLNERISATAASPTATSAPTPAQAQRPSAPSRPAVPTETIEAAPARAPTPALPEAQIGRDVRAQPVTGQPLPTQPTPRAAPIPQPAPQPQGRSVEPASPRRSVPETVTDDLSSNTEPPADPSRPNFAEVMGARISTAAVNGIALDGGTGMPDPTELARRQARMAPAEQIETPAETMARGKAELPPASIGPSSLRAAAQQGDPAAAFEVGSRFAEAKGVKQDFQQALVWYSRAAQQGFVPAQYRLATIYEGGLHGNQDIARAKVWYKRAAEQGHVKAMHNLAVLAAGTTQGQPDYQTAARWFSEAADRGLADSQFNLGVLHESGLGVTKDALQAFKWFSLAARSGDKEALRRRDQVMASFTPQAAQSADRLVQAWRARPTDMKANDPRSAGMAFQEARSRQFQQMQEQMQAAQLRQQQPAAPAPEAKTTARPAQRTTASTTTLLP